MKLFSLSLLGVMFYLDVFDVIDLLGIVICLFGSDIVNGGYNENLFVLRYLDI